MRPSQVCPPLLEVSELLSVFGCSLARGGKQSLTSAVQDDCTGVRVVASILGSATFDGDNITNFHRIPAPAHPHQRTRRPQFYAPICDSAGVTFDVNEKPG